MKKKNKQKPTINPNISRILDDNSWEIFDEDRNKVLEKWQYYESADLSPQDRYELDKEAYIKTFFTETVCVHDNSFVEEHLLQLLIDNMSKVKHPVWVIYKNFLTDKQKKLKAESQKKTQENRPVTKSYKTVL